MYNIDVKVIGDNRTTFCVKCGSYRKASRVMQKVDDVMDDVELIMYNHNPQHEDYAAIIGLSFEDEESMERFRSKFSYSL